MLALLLLKRNRFTKRSVSALPPPSCSIDIPAGGAFSQVERYVVGRESDFERLICLMTDASIL